MLALDQMEGGDLPASAVVPLLSSSDPVLRDTASWLVSRHVEWGRRPFRLFPDEAWRYQVRFGRLGQLRTR